MGKNRVFFPQEALDRWLAEGRVEITGAELTIVKERRRYRLVEAIRIVSEEAGHSDPDELVGKVNQAVNAALADADVKDRFARLGAEPAGGTPPAFAAMVRADTAKWKKIIAERKITTD